MKARSVFACAAAGFAMMAFGATNAVADGPNGTLEISPGEVRPGDTVTLSATCDYPEFTSPAPIESYFLNTTNLTGDKDEAGVWHLSGTTTVRTDVGPGKASALFSCGPVGDVTVGEFTILPTGDEGYAAIGVDDREIRAGQEVRVAASCQDARFTGSKIVSPVLTAPDLTRDRGESISSPMFAMGRVSADAKPGTYPISFTCVDREIDGEFTVEAAGKTPVKAPAQVPVKPKGPADTGSLDESATGSSAVVIGAGAAALLAAGGVGVWAHRRRQQA